MIVLKNMFKKSKLSKGLSLGHKHNDSKANKKHVINKRKKVPTARKCSSL